MSFSSTSIQGHHVVTVEIRPGEGGTDAALFAGELAQAIGAWCRRNDTETQVVSAPRSQTIHVSGCLDLSWLAGTHRIMRIPPGDAHGRRHTSSVTLAVLDAYAETRVVLHDDDFDMDTYRASGAGGQHRNKTESAVRLTHRASGLVVCCADNRSQHRNLADARAELVRRLTAAARVGAADGRNDIRVSQFTSGGTTARTYTWNEQRDEVTSGDGRKTRMRDAFAGRLDKLAR